MDKKHNWHTENFIKWLSVNPDIIFDWKNIDLPDLAETMKSEYKSQIFDHDFEYDVGFFNGALNHYIDQIDWDEVANFIVTSKLT